MVDPPCRSAVRAARWNGQAPQVTTGAARVSASHCQPSNCRAGTIDSGQHRDGESGGDEHPLAQRGDVGVGLLGGRRVVGRRRLLPGQLGGVAGARDGGHQVVRGDAVGEGDPRLLGGVVDGRDDAGHPVELLLDPGGAGRAGHPADRELDTATSAAGVTSSRGQLVAGLVDGLADGLLGQRLVADDSHGRRAALDQLDLDVAARRGARAARRSRRCTQWPQVMPSDAVGRGAAHVVASS